MGGLLQMQGGGSRVWYGAYVARTSHQRLTSMRERAPRLCVSLPGRVGVGELVGRRGRPRLKCCQQSNTKKQSKILRQTLGQADPIFEEEETGVSFDHSSQQIKLRPFNRKPTLPPFTRFPVLGVSVTR